ncbi:hypothetical protein CYMTET_14545, partial [Cymbomonas tetramitiformis]
AYTERPTKTTLGNSLPPELVRSAGISPMPSTDNYAFCTLGDTDGRPVGDFLQWPSDEEDEDAARAPLPAGPEPADSKPEQRFDPEAFRLGESGDHFEESEVKTLAEKFGFAPPGGEAQIEHDPEDPSAGDENDQEQSNQGPVTPGNQGAEGVNVMWMKTGLLQPQQFPYPSRSGTPLHGNALTYLTPAETRASTPASNIAFGRTVEPRGANRDTKGTVRPGLPYIEDAPPSSADYAYLHHSTDSTFQPARIRTNYNRQFVADMESGNLALGARSVSPGRAAVTPGRTGTSGHAASRAPNASTAAGFKTMGSPSSKQGNSASTKSSPNNSTSYQSPGFVTKRTETPSVSIFPVISARTVQKTMTIDTGYTPINNTSK